MLKMITSGDQGTTLSGNFTALYVTTTNVKLLREKKNHISLVIFMSSL
jgi:hypothetical protein